MQCRQSVQRKVELGEIPGARRAEGHSRQDALYIANAPKPLANGGVTLGFRHGAHEMVTLAQ